MQQQLSPSVKRDLKSPYIKNVQLCASTVYVNISE